VVLFMPGKVAAVTDDYVDTLSERALIQFSDEVIDQLTVHRTGTIAFILAMSKRESTESISALIATDPEDTKKIRALQNKALRHLDLMRWIGQAVREGVQVWQSLSTVEQAEIVREIMLANEGDPTMSDS
jgi:hypothetical protein